MPFYRDIETDTAAGRRTLDRLLALRERLNAEIPPRDLKTRLLLATWNIREFDSPSYGERLREAFYYIAEIVARFDLIALQEVRRDLHALNRLCRILGPHWKYLVTDVTEGAPGNRERMAFLYDTRKVEFSGLAGELVLPPIRLADGTYQPVTQLARTPYMCGFTAGWTRFVLVTVHILYGSGRSEDPQRLGEIRQFVDFMRARAGERDAWASNLILLGDFNIFAPDDKTFAALTETGFRVPEKIQRLPSNAARNKHYDQIAFRVQKGHLGFTGNAGVFDFYRDVFRDGDEQVYIAEMGGSYDTNSRGKARDSRSRSRYYRTYWRTYQMSDHFPMWVELEIDNSDAYLKKRLQDAET